MTEQNLPLTSFAIGGFRSFGDKVQRFGNLSRINLFIGQNNCGKSNVLRFLHDVYPHLSNGENKALNLSHLDRHIPKMCSFITGTSISLFANKQGERLAFINEVSSKIPNPNTGDHQHQLQAVLCAFQKKAELDGTGDDVWFYFDQNKKLLPHVWDEAFKTIDDSTLRRLWSGLVNMSGGDRRNWYPDSLARLTPHFKAINVKMIPAIRQIGEHGSVSDEFSGEGIIERLARLQNPDVLNQKDKAKFQQINDFLRNVIDNNSAAIEIPHACDTIHVHISGKTLPLESLGTGIHEVIILAAAATILERNVICMN